MKRILITGKNSYIGNNLEKWLLQTPQNYSVTKVSVRGNEWLSMDWSKYDVLVNVSGVAHIRETNKNKSYYYKINRDLAIDIANKAKQSKVSHFIQISTMSVFGKNRGAITESTEFKPNSSYGKSKFEADKQIKELETDGFTVSIIRPPMVYGVDSPGNFMKLYNFILKLKIFPKVSNKRSMIYVDNLVECIRKVIDNQKSGCFYPQNKKYVNTYLMAKTVAEANNSSLITLPNIFQWVKFLSAVNPTVSKVFGDLYYERKMSIIHDSNNKPIDYNVVEFEESMRKISHEK